MLGKKKTEGVVPMGLAKTLEEITSRYRKREAIRFEGKAHSYRELDENANRVAGGLKKLGIQKGDRVALMLPNIPEFAFNFFGIQKLGAVAVPFNTMYGGGEISFILKDSGARAIICPGNFANLINEIREDCPALEHVIVTGKRRLVFIDPDASVNVQMVFDKSAFEPSDNAFPAIGQLFVDVFKSLGADDA